MNLGPFDVDAAQVQNLGNRFTAFVNELLEREVAAHSLYGSDLSITENETTADGGVDAALRGAMRTDWLPAGDSAWQFKRTGIGPKGCADEFEKAKWVHEYVKAGGSYIIALGASLNDKLVEARRKSVAEKAVELSLLPSDDRSRIRVYDANNLARWASRFPAFAVSRLIGGPGSSAVDYESWSRSRWHQAAWVADESRTKAIEAIRAQIVSPGIVDLRVQGDSGLGKSRLILEALREENLQRLVAYVADEREVDGELLAYLARDGRTAIFVVDDCAPERHAKLAERLPADPHIKLVTIGGGGAAATKSPIISVAILPEEETDSFLKKNYPVLSVESRRFITRNTSGNTRWTILFADRITGEDGAQAADLIARDDIEAFVTTFLPAGKDFFFSAVLALVERVGWDRELRPQLEILAQFAGTTPDAFEKVGRDLEQRGLLQREGRYRAITPHPLAVFLAAEAWRTDGERILEELLPELDEEAALSLFRRVADLGQFEPARSVLPRLLSPEGPFGSLDAIENGRMARLLTQLAIVLPDEVTRHLGALIADTPTDVLRSQASSRRDLVWTLEKLVWHRRTFTSAADSLLRLAEAENETWANNATGTWIDLFGTMLPGTAATPNERIAYVAKVASSTSSARRPFAVKAATRMLAGSHESIAVSGELQGGVLVERRGTPETAEEAGEYRRAAIELLVRLTSDPDKSIADAATIALIDATHPLLDDPWVGDALFAALADLTGPALDRLRSTVTGLAHMQERHGESPGNALILERLNALLEALPPPTELQEFRILLQLRPWELPEDELQQRIGSSLSVLDERGELEDALRLLEAEDASTAWFVGRALAGIKPADAAVQRRLAQMSAENPNALVGYLTGLADAGASSAFDEFLDGPAADGLDDAQQLAVAVRAPVTERGKLRIYAMVADQPVAVGARHLFGWQRGLDEDEIVALAGSWASRIGSQEDYIALIDWLNLLPPNEPLPGGRHELVYELLMRRREFPDLGRVGWDWNQLAMRLVESRGDELGKLVLELVDEGKLGTVQHAPESELLLRSAQLFPEAVWEELVARLGAGSWRVELEVRGWLLRAVPSEVIEAWVGDDVTRARLVATIAPTGAEQPTAVTRFLLARFGDDQNVASGLWGDFMSGSWVGPESGRIESQIAQLEQWRAADEPEGVQKWAGEVIRGLEDRRRVALEREAEGGY